MATHKVKHAYCTVSSTNNKQKANNMLVSPEFQRVVGEYRDLVEALFFLL